MLLYRMRKTIQLNALVVSSAAPTYQSSSFRWLTASMIDDATISITSVKNSRIMQRLIVFSTCDFLNGTCIELRASFVSAPA